MVLVTHQEKPITLNSPVFVRKCTRAFLERYVVCDRKRTNGKDAVRCPPDPFMFRGRVVTDARHGCFIFSAKSFANKGIEECLVWIQLQLRGEDALQEGFEHVRLDVTLLTMCYAMPREYPLQPGLNDSTAGSLHINLSGPLRTSQNCHSSQMGTTPKRGLKNHFEKLHNCALQGTPLKACESSKMTVCRGYHMCQSKFMYSFQIWALQCPSEEKSNCSMSSAGAFQTTLQKST